MLDAARELFDRMGTLTDSPSAGIVAAADALDAACDSLAGESVT